MRLAALGSTVQRAASPAYGSARSRSALRRRLVAGVLIALSLVLITGYFRETESGRLHDVQGVAASVLHPFQVGAERVARPFQDAWGWVSGFVNAKSENERLKERLRLVERQALQNIGAARENVELRRALAYRSSRTFPRGYDSVAAAVIAHRLNEFQERIGVAAGSNDGVRMNDPVVDTEGHLVGYVSRVAPRSSRVTLLTDGEFAAAAYDMQTETYGLVSHGQGAGESLVLDLVPKDKLVEKGDLIATAGTRAGGELRSLYPKDIAIGTVSSVGRSDIDVHQSIQVDPLADFSSLSAVLILVPQER
jgi:rod shape-determining protein MreC